MKNNKIVPVFFASDKNYIPYLTVAIKSLIDKSSDKNEYRLYILTNDVRDEDIVEIRSYEKENVKVEIVDVNEKIESIKNKVALRDYYSVSIYFRLFIPSMFPQYDKAIYLDSDIVVLKDLKDYYDIDLKDNFLAGRRDLNAYQKQRLKFPFKTNLYVNAGSLLLNLKKMRLQNIQPLLFETTYKYNNIFYYADQDVINYLFKGKIKELPPKYNGNIVLETPFNKTIYHYLGNAKPWKEYSIDFHEWYKYQAYKNAILIDENFPLKDYFIYLIDKIMYYYQFLINTAAGI